MTDFNYIEENIKKLEFNLNEACARSGRRRDGIMLLPVSKNQETDKILSVYRLGFRHFGENRVQELVRKIAEAPADINWHLIGSLQSNKVKYVIGKVSLIHSLDSLTLMQEIDKRSFKAGLITECLIQVNISREESKSGLFIEEIDEFIKKAEDRKNIKILGLMTIGPNTDDKNHLKSLYKLMESKFIDTGCKKMHNVSMKYLSMGMSGDYAEAIDCGANIIRIGTSIFGPRE